MSQKVHITLSKLAETVSAALAVPELHGRWVVAEIANISVNATSGHCYLELVEKSPISGQTLASLRATIWAAKYKLIANYFKVETALDLAVGMKVMFCCTLSYHPIYSLAVNITDIDPTYTVGEAQRQRQLIIETLKKEGIFDMNKELEMPLVLQKIAVISSPTAAGYEDFVHQIDDTQFNFKLTLFPAIMQGKDTERSVCDALSHIANQEDSFDAVVIIRGGGANTDLQWFDSYNICSYIAQMPLPVITGIGHQRDSSVADMVANLSLKTPTAVAAFIIDAAQGYFDAFSGIHFDIINGAKKAIELRNTYLNNISLKFTDIVKSSLNRQESLLQLKKSTLTLALEKTISGLKTKNGLLKERLTNYSANMLTAQKNKISHLDQLIKSHDPKNIIKRGFAIVKLNTKIVSSVDQIKIDDIITIEIKDKTIKSKVTQI